MYNRRRKIYILIILIILILAYPWLSSAYEKKLEKEEKNMFARQTGLLINENHLVSNSNSTFLMPPSRLAPLPNFHIQNGIVSYVCGNLSLQICSFRVVNWLTLLSDS
jgi:hypothetical protein